MSLPPPTARQAQVIWFALTTLAVALTVGIVGVVLWALGKVLVVLSPVLGPLAVAGVIAFILDPLVGWLTRRGVPRLRAILLVFGVATVLVLGAFGSIVPRVVVEVRDLSSRMSEYQDKVRVKIQNWINDPPTSVTDLIRAWRGETNVMTLPEVVVSTNVPAQTRYELGTNVVEPPSGVAVAGGTNGAAGDLWWWRLLDPVTRDAGAWRSAGEWAAAIAPDVGRWVLGQLGRVASWFGVLAGLALIPIYAFYFLLEKSSIERQWTDYLPVSDSKFKDELVWLLTNINDALIVFFRGQVLVAVCDGVMYTIGFLVIGLPYAVLLGVMATVLTIVPFLGAIVTCVAALLIALVSGSGWHAPLLVLVVFMIVQGVEGWVVQPKIIGDRVGLHPVSIIIALLVGTTLMGGLLGGLLAIPATAVLRALMFRYVWRIAPGVSAGGGLAP